MAVLKTSNTSTKPSSSPSSDKDENFEEEALNKHNEYRRTHGCQPLKLDQKLCSYAQEWANKLARENRFEHRSNSSYGENLYCTWSSNPKSGCSGDKAVESWYDEIKDHQFGKEPNSMGTGHFTQVVWKNSKNLGIAKQDHPVAKLSLLPTMNQPEISLDNTFKMFHLRNSLRPSFDQTLDYLPFCKLTYHDTNLMG